MKNKLKAFTLFELVVSLTVSAILIAIVYTGMDVIQQRFEVNKNKQAKNYADRLIDHVLENDIHRSRWVTASERFVVCHLDSNHTIQYVLSDSNLIRIDSVTHDTISQEVWRVRHWFQQEEFQDSTLADLIWIEMNDDRIYSFKKWYAADVLIHF